MKKVKNSWVMGFILATGLSMMSCTKDNDLNSDPEIDQIEENIESRTWKITLFEEDGKDETAHFSGYAFIFNADGVLLAEKGEISYEGSWSITNSGSNDDSQDDVHFNIYFNLSNDFQDLNDDWDILASSDAKIDLIDVSGGNGGTDYLSLESY